MSRDYSSVDVDISASVHDGYDLPDLIRRHRKVYAVLPVKALGHQEWERPSVFLADHITDRIDVGELDIDRIDIDWTEDDYRALCRVCPEADLAGQFVSREVRDRQPGPNDVPLFGEA